MRFVIAVEDDHAHPVEKWDVIETQRSGTVIDDEFVVPFSSWDHAARVLTEMRDKARAIDRGEAVPDAFHEIIGGD